MTIDPDNRTEFDPQPNTGLLLPPWEERERYGFLNSLYLTVKDVLLLPGRFFARMPSQVGLNQPLLFAIVVGVISTFCIWIWALTISPFKFLVADTLTDAMQPAIVAGIMFVFSPILVVVAVVISAAFLHLILHVLGGDNLGFEATFRVVTYAFAPFILTVFPVCSLVIAPIWSLVIAIIGMQKIHDTDTWRAAVAVLIPAAICYATFGNFALLWFTLSPSR